MEFTKCVYKLTDHQEERNCVYNGRGRKMLKNQKYISKMDSNGNDEYCGRYDERRRTQCVCANWANKKNAHCTKIAT